MSIDSLGLEQVNLVGDHTGALLSIVLAGSYPDRVKRVVLDGLPCWDSKKGKAIWERFFLTRFTDTTSYHLSVDPLITWEEAKALGPQNGARLHGRSPTRSTRGADCGNE